MTQQALAELVNVHVNQVRRYESGASQPTLDVIRRLAVALQVSADVLIFGADERGPDGELLLQFEAISKFAAEEKQVIKALLEGMISNTKPNAGPQQPGQITEHRRKRSSLRLPLVARTPS